MPLETRAAVPHQIGDYDVLAKIAEGGMGTVYKGRHRSTGEIVAIKILPPATAKNPILLKRFEQEYRAAAGPRSSEHRPGHRVLRQRRRRRSWSWSSSTANRSGQRSNATARCPRTRRFASSPRSARDCTEPTSRSLIHRDVKPDNILVNGDGMAKLTDLGLVKDVDNEMNLTKTGRGLGTPHFMAPEQFRNAKNADVRCDVYSLGATLYMMVTGEVPFGKVGPLECWLRSSATNCRRRAN